jgi:DNA-directed RNA polymerase subunit RPC12/RpoP
MTKIRVRYDHKTAYILCPQCGLPLLARMSREYDNVHVCREVWRHSSVALDEPGWEHLVEEKTLEYTCSCGFSLPGDSDFEVVNDPSLPSWRDHETVS